MNCILCLTYWNLGYCGLCTYYNTLEVGYYEKVILVKDRSFEVNVASAAAP